MARIPLDRFFKALKNLPEFKDLIETYKLDQIHSKAFVWISKPPKFIFIHLEEPDFCEKERLKIKVTKDFYISQSKERD